MKLTIPRIFDSGTITKAFKKAGIDGAEGFVSYLADATEELIKSVKSGLSIEDNFNGSVKTLILKHNVATAVGVPQPNKRVVHMFPTYVSAFENPIQTFAWTYDDKGSLRVRATFLGSPTAAIDVRVVMLY